MPLFKINRRFSLRTALIAMALVSLLFGLISYRARNQIAVRVEAWKHFGMCTFDNTTLAAKFARPLVDVLDHWVGPDFVRSIECVDFNAVPPKELVEAIHRLPGRPDVFVRIPEFPVDPDNYDWVNDGVPFQSYELIAGDSGWRERFYGPKSPFKTHKINLRQ